MKRMSELEGMKVVLSFSLYSDDNDDGGGMGRRELIIEMTVDGDEEGHDASCVWDRDGYHIVDVQHLWDTCLSVCGEEGRGKTMRERERNEK